MAACATFRRRPHARRPSGSGAASSGTASIPYLLADEQRATFASAAAALSYFASNTLKPWVVRLERAFQQSVLASRYRLSIDLTALLKGDVDAYAAALLKLRQAGVMTSNEARATLNLPAHTDGDSLTPPSVMSGKPGDAPSGDTPQPSKKLNGHAQSHKA